jgi:diguanylate cyclase (GGDEF)-like protein
MWAKIAPRDIFAPAAGVIVLALIVLLSALVVFASRADLAARQHEEAVVANGLNGRITEIASAVAAHIAQAGLSRHHDHRTDAEWAHVALGEPLGQALRFDYVFLIDAEDDAVYAMAQGDIAELNTVSRFGAVATDLIANVRQVEHNLPPRSAHASFEAPIQASVITAIAGDLHVITATRIPNAGRTRAPIAITVQAFNDDFLFPIADRFLLNDLRLHENSAEIAPRRAHVPLSDSQGETLGTLSWEPRRPGAALLQGALPPVLILIAALGVMGWMLFQRGRAAAQNLVASEARATHLAYHDALTGLPNRLLLADRLGRAVEDLRRRQTPFAVHCIDLDRFKDVNDTFGHHAGDELIKEAARRIAQACRSNDTIARLGGDEFAVVQIGADASGAATLAERIVKTLGEPIDLSVGRVHIGGSVGVSLLSEASIEPQECLRQADLALYRCKEAGRGRYCFFEPEMDAAVRFRRTLQDDLHRAIHADELHLVYQPQVDGDGRIVGLEALVRWDHPQRGPLSPTLFIPVAEECGLIDPLGFFTLRRAFEDSRRWPHLKVAINISATQLRMKDFVPRLRLLAEEMAISPAMFELEITEGVLLGDDPVTHEALNEIRSMGFSLALDDFGTGYSSLSYLRRYPIDKIKIDRAFITHLGVDREADAVVTAIVRLARALRLSVIAEGVETAEQRQRLARAGCSEVQGYLFGRPSAPQVIEGMLTPSADGNERKALVATS